MGDDTYAIAAIGVSAVVMFCVGFASCRAIRQSKENVATSAWYDIDAKSRTASDYGSNSKSSLNSKGRKNREKRNKKKRKKSTDSSLDDPALVSKPTYAGLGVGENSTNITASTTGTPSEDGQSIASVTSIATSVTSFGDEGDIGENELLQTFLAVLQDGLALVMHASRGKPKRVKIWLEDTELMWRTARTVLRKKQCIDINDISHVESGKTSAVFRRTSAARLSDDLCLSLICTNGSTIDLEASSRMEREAIKQGFTMVIHSAQQQRADRGGAEAV